MSTYITGFIQIIAVGAVFITTYNVIVGLQGLFKVLDRADQMQGTIQHDVVSVLRKLEAMDREIKDLKGAMEKAQG